MISKKIILFLLVSVELLVFFNIMSSRVRVILYNPARTQHYRNNIVSVDGSSDQNDWMLAMSELKDKIFHRGANNVIRPEPSSGSTDESLAKGSPKYNEKRPMKCSGCLRHDFQYLIQNEAVCSQSLEEPVDLLLLIVTGLDGTKRRDGIRETWARLTRNNTANVRHVFLLGMSYDKNLMQAVESESRIHKDIIMEDFHDSYWNLTLKTVMGLKWAQNFCPKAEFVMKVDDDMWVNIPEVMKVLKTKQAELQNSVGGECRHSKKPNRDKTSKWYASVLSYSDHVYPPFCSGTCYVMSMSVAKKVYDVSKDVPFFHLEDVYVAFCLRKLGLSVLTLSGFNINDPEIKMCDMKSASILTVHRILPDTLREIMNADC